MSEHRVRLIGLGERLHVSQQSALHVDQDRSCGLIFLLRQRGRHVLREPFQMLADNPAHLFVGRAPRRYFVPPYVGTRGWIGLRLDVDVNWDEVTRVVRESHDLVVPRPRLRRR